MRVKTTSEGVREKISSAFGPSRWVVRREWTVGSGGMFSCLEGRRGREEKKAGVWDRRGVCRPGREWGRQPADEMPEKRVPPEDP